MQHCFSNYMTLYGLCMNPEIRCLLIKVCVLQLVNVLNKNSIRSFVFNQD